MALNETQQKALKAFKKKLKHYRLDDESHLGGPLTSGRSSNIQGIEPPGGFPPGVWDELVAAGRLRKEDRGTYSLVPQPQP